MAESSPWAEWKSPWNSTAMAMLPDTSIKKAHALETRAVAAIHGHAGVEVDATDDGCGLRLSTWSCWKRRSEGWPARSPVRSTPRAAPLEALLVAAVDGDGGMHVDAADHGGWLAWPDPVLLDGPERGLAGSLSGEVDAAGSGAVAESEGGLRTAPVIADSSILPAFSSRVATR